MNSDLSHSSDSSYSSQASNRGLLSLLNLPGDAIALAAPKPWRLVYSNRAFFQRLGWPSNPSSELPLTSVLRTSPPSRLITELDRVSRGDIAEVQLEATLIRKSSPEHGEPVVLRLAPMELGNQTCVGLVVERGESTADNAGNSIRRDSLTNLVDRSQLFERLSTLMAGERAADRSFAVFFIDLDAFKQINDRHGHLVGDLVLKEAAARMAKCIRDEDLIVRYGGDEFVALLESVRGWEEFSPVIGRIHAALREPIALPEGDLFITASIGVAEFSARHRVPEDLLAEADRAMYAVKRRRAVTSTR